MECDLLFYGVLPHTKMDIFGPLLDERLKENLWNYEKVSSLSCLLLYLSLLGGLQSTTFDLGTKERFLGVLWMKGIIVIANNNIYPFYRHFNFWSLKDGISSQGMQLMISDMIQFVTVTSLETVWLTKNVPNNCNTNGICRVRSVTDRRCACWIRVFIISNVHFQTKK